MNPLVYLPIELRTRELTARVELAKLLQASGHDVIIGQQWAIFDNPKLPPGVILFKTVNAIQGHNMQNFKASGHKVLALDEEALLCGDVACMLANTSAKALGACDLFLAQNRDHGEAIHLGYQVPYTVVGNPRIDLCRGDSFKPEGESILALHGPFILFNTNYGTLNSAWGSVEAVRKIETAAGFIHNADDLDRFNQALMWEEANMLALEMAILHAKATASTHRKKIIIRPHPAENPAYWAQSGVTIITDTDPLPWLWASDLLVHTSCTTGLEAAVMGKKAFNIEVMKGTCARLTSEVNMTVESFADFKYAFDNYIYEFFTGRRDLFPPGANLAISAALSQHAFPATRAITDFKAKERRDRERQKFTMEPDDAHRLLGRCETLWDSLYLMKAA